VTIKARAKRYICKKENMRPLLITLVLFTITVAGLAQPSPDLIRQYIAQGIASLNIPAEEVYKTEDLMAGKIPIRLYYPSGKKNLPVIYHVHGGALVAGDLETHDNISRKIANATQSIVIALDYRRAPENPFPASINDVLAVYEWILANPKRIGGKKSALSVLADSGGCLMAAALQLDIRRKKLENKIHRVVYINPAFDLRNPDEGLYSLVINWYLSGADPNNQRASPILARDFTAFAPCLIVVNEKDVLLPQGMAFSQKLEAVSVPHEVLNIPGEDHFGEYWAAAHPKTDQALEASVRFLKNTLVKEVNKK
jgi:acetyl esterase